MLKPLLLSLAAAALVAAPARGTCAQPKTQQEQNSCASQDSSAAKKEMEFAVQSFGKLGLFDQKAFKTSQASFLVYLKAQCTTEASLAVKQKEPQMGPALYSKCEAKMYRSRVAVLKAAVAALEG
jgi:uncharacterized protein YecT (DUF1311 family)